MAVPCSPAGDKQVQLRRGTTAQNDAFTGADGEMSYDTQEKRMRIHDGVTVGGFRLGLKSEIDLKLNLTGGTLTGDLDIAAGIHLNTDGTIIAASGAFVISSGGLITFPDDVRQIFNPGANNAGINVGALAGDPSAPVNGDIWYDSTANELTARINGVNVSLGSGGSTPPFVDTTSIVMGSVDNTKLLRFEVDGFTAGATRVLTPQNNSYIIAGTNIAQTFSLLQTFDADQGINIGTMNLTDPGSAGALNIVGGDVSVVGGGLFAQSLNINLGNFAVSSAGVLTFADGVRQTFNPNGTTPGLNVGSLAGDPSTPINGDIWYDSTANELTARINGVNVALGAGGASPPFSDSTALVMGSVTPSKLLRFEVDGFTAATTRVLTPQNADYIIAGTNITNSFQVVQNFDGDAGLMVGTMLLTDPSSSGVLTISGGSVGIPGGNLTLGASAEIVLRSDGSADFASGLLTIDTAGGMTFPDDVRQTFNPGATVAGLNVGSIAGDPSTPINGDLWYDSTANELTARINGVNVALGTAGYALIFGMVAPLSMADSTTYYFTLTADAAPVSVTYNNVKIAIPKTGILRRFDILVRVAGALGSAETVSHFVRINDTTDVGQIDCSYNVAAQNFSAVINQAVTAGDFVAIKVVTPAWVTNPTTVRNVATIYIE